MARFRRERIQDTVVSSGRRGFARWMCELGAGVIGEYGSAQPAPEHEQPAPGGEIESGETSRLKLKLAEAAVEMARITRMRGGWRGWWPRGRRLCLGGGIGLW